MDSRVEEAPEEIPLAHPTAGENPQVNLVYRQVVNHPAQEQMHLAHPTA